jgi:hypothetical protein
VGRPGCGSELNIFSSNSQLQKHAEHILIKKKCFTKMKNKQKQDTHTKDAATKLPPQKTIIAILRNISHLMPLCTLQRTSDASWKGE